MGKLAEDDAGQARAELGVRPNEGEETKQASTGSRCSVEDSRRCASLSKRVAMNLSDEQCDAITAEVDKTVPATRKHEARAYCCAAAIRAMKVE
jgi:hypothetical protein